MNDKDKYVNIADLKARLRYWCRSRGASKQMQESLMETIKRIPYTIRADISETLEIENGWIPCSERLPSEFNYVLCSGRDGIGVLRYIGSKWLDENAIAYSTNEITHWMPLPEPPEEVQE